MLDYEDDLIHGLVQLIKDREAKDYIYDTLIRYRFPDWGLKNYEFTDKVKKRMREDVYKRQRSYYHDA